MDTPILPVEQLTKLQEIEQDWLFDKLLWKLGSHKHIVLTAEKGWGILDYVNELGFQLAEKKPDMQICYVDIKPAHSPNAFLQLFASALFIKFPEECSHLELDINSIDVLSLPQFIAHKSKVNIGVFLINSHFFHRFRDQTSFLRLLRIKFKNQKNCVFCFSGDINRDLRDLFHYPGPLSGIGQYYELRHNHFKHRSFIIRKLFHDHNKRIGHINSVRMSFLVDNNPFYLNLLAWHALILTRNTCTEAILEKSLTNLIKHFNYRFQMIVERLTPKQLSYLKALVDGNQKLYSSAVREAYQLGSSSNIARIKASLEKKEIIQTGKKEPAFKDPIFREWFRRKFSANRAD